jgi:hypothetical protein
VAQSDDVQDIFIGQSRDAHIRLEERTSILLELGREHDSTLRKLVPDVDAAHSTIRDLRREIDRLRSGDIAELKVLARLLMGVQGAQGIALVVLIVLQWNNRRVEWLH